MIEEHKRHTCIDINLAITDFDNVISEDIKKCERSVKQLEDERKELKDKIKTLNEIIGNKKEKIKSNKKCLSSTSFAHKKTVAENIRRNKIMKVDY